MTTDTLAALLRQFDVSDEMSDAWDFNDQARWLAARGVVVLPADHPLRTGEPSEAMILAGCDAYTKDGALRPHQNIYDAVSSVVRAALAVLRES